MLIFFPTSSFLWGLGPFLHEVKERFNEVSEDVIFH